MGELGLVAAQEAGIELARLALIPDPGDQLVAVTSALLEGMDIVGIAGTAGSRRVTASGSQRRPASQARS
jgi:hypothetical protein